jgi:hypothetical protein
MKVTVKQQPEEFKPVTLEITLESREELEAMYQVANYSSQVEKMINKGQREFGEKSDLRIDPPLRNLFAPLKSLRK